MSDRNALQLLGTWLVFMLVGAVIAGCATNPSKAHDYCNDDRLIKFKSAADIAALPDYLAKEIDAHNVAHRKACGD